MRICIVSDLHECHREVTIPPADLLLVAGDISLFSQRPSMIVDFNEWLSEQPVRYRCCIPGNHEYAIEAEPDKWRRRLSNATMLINEAVTIEGIKIWGSPVTPHGGAFAMRNEADRDAFVAGLCDVFKPALFCLVRQ
jgi:predicted phosphohydrolase